ncbi:MAG: outer membrane lipoprotein-sorting protein [Myxococcota bacterium]|nr:outer membrane lipoprotein-sorting protein [Myxococcota bacterium]
MRQLLLLPLALLLGAPATGAPPDGRELARLINERPRPAQVSRIAVLTLVDGQGKQRVRRLRNFWKLHPDARWLVFFALTPPELKHHAFLAHDPFDATRPDDQWFYRPTRRRAVRIPELSRGEPFLGSEFSFEDMKKEDRVEVDEFTWKTLGARKVEGREIWLLEQVPATPEIARALGYGRIVSQVDPRTFVRRRIEFFDRELAPLKTFEVRDVAQLGGFWMAQRIDAANHKTGHRSVLVFSEIDNESPVSDEIFTVRTLEAERGPHLGRPRQ